MNGDLGKWELRIYALAVAGAGGAFRWIAMRIVRRWDAFQKIRRADHLRLRQHDEVIVEKLRDGIPFPNLSDEDEGGG